MIFLLVWVKQTAAVTSRSKSQKLCVKAQNDQRSAQSALTSSVLRTVHVSRSLSLQMRRVLASRRLLALCASPLLPTERRGRAKQTETAGIRWKKLYSQTQKRGLWSLRNRKLKHGLKCYCTSAEPVGLQVLLPEPSWSSHAPLIIFNPMWQYLGSC